METTKEVCETIVKKTTDAVVQNLFKKPDAIETKQKECFDFINKKISTLVMKSQPSTAKSSQEHESQTCSPQH